MNRRIVTGSYDDDDEQPEREYRGDGEWDSSYRRRKPRSAAMIVGITLASLLAFSGSHNRRRFRLPLVNRQIGRNRHRNRSASQFEESTLCTKF